MTHELIAFALGSFVTWRGSYYLTRYVLGNKPLVFEQTLRKLDYDVLFKLRGAIDREVGRRTAVSAS